jgi:formylglycine-generating enzyme required for sulfatase activity
MSLLRALAVLPLTCIIAVPPTVAAGPRKCAPDAVLAGTLCVDRYEASVWQIPATNRGLVKTVQLGKATLAELEAGGAVQVSRASAMQDCLAPVFPAGFPASGNWTEPVYATSLPGVLPTGCITWYQAEQACALAGKRLLTNDEWQIAAAGTTDAVPVDDTSTLCNIAAGNGPSLTGARTDCVSRWGANDMVGNLYEWVGEWSDRPGACSAWPPDFGGDASCYGGAGAGSLPGAALRGGYWGFLGGTSAGPFATFAFDPPSFEAVGTGFRCAR